MTATNAQKRASKKYRDKKAAEGIKQHLIFTDNEHWSVILPVVREINKLDLSQYEKIEILEDRIVFVKGETNASN